MNEKNTKKILVTGASGYVGSRLVSLLLENKYKVRAASRNPENLSKFSWANNPDVETVKLDASKRESLVNACKDCDYAFYFIHSMDETSSDFAETDRIAARNMVFASESTGIKRIIYLGGLGNENLHFHHNNLFHMQVILTFVEYLYRHHIVPHLLKQYIKKRQ